MLNRNVWVAGFVVATLAVTGCDQKKEDPAVTDNTETTVGETITNQVNEAGDAAIEGAQTAGNAVADGATATADGAVDVVSDGATAASQGASELVDGTKNTLNPATEVKVPADQQY